MGWVDAWRRLHPHRREYTWQSPRRWFSMRLDYLFLSPSLAPRLMGHNTTSRSGWKPVYRTTPC